MTTREKIFVGAMCIAILYGAYELFSGGPSRKKTTPQAAKPVEDLSGFVTDLTQKMVKDKVSESYSYLIAQAGAGWTKDPLIQSTTPLKTKRAAAAETSRLETRPALWPDFVYTGFLQLGDTKLAVINGIEYGTGESLGINDFYVKHINEQRVVIGKVESKEKFEIPIQEIDSGFDGKPRK